MRDHVSKEEVVLFSDAGNRTVIVNLWGARYFYRQGQYG